MLAWLAKGASGNWLTCAEACATVNYDKVDVVSFTQDYAEGVAKAEANRFADVDLANPYRTGIGSPARGRLAAAATKCRQVQVIP